VSAVAARVQGTVVRFDPVKGYGFITPEGGGEDAFLHVNDLLDDKSLIRPGTVVQFSVEPGERGVKAGGVRIVSQPPAPAPVAPRPVRDADAASHGADDEDALVDVVSAKEFRSELTEILLQVRPPLDAAQILAVRERVEVLGRGYGWVTA
jgi:cold shock CspA family protein